jgi:hypothetical protein
MGFRVCETAVQCLGGYGFCKEYPLEHYLRDSKIMSLYEGTNGIQAMDLMGRKMRMNSGAPFKAFMSELVKFHEKNKNHPVLGSDVEKLYGTAKRLEEVAETLSGMSKANPLLWAAATYPALLCFGDVIAVWRLLDLARIAQNEIDAGNKDTFYSGKVIQAKYFAEATLPITLGRMETCLTGNQGIIEMPEEAF